MKLEVGEKLPELVKPAITQTQLVMYSGASGDFNPIHTVEAYAEQVGLGGTIAHGMLSMAFVGQMLKEAMGPRGRLQEWGVRFQEMVRPGDVLTCSGTITGVREEADGHVVECDVVALTQKGVKAVSGTATFRMLK
ncbi:MAG: MaoC/PaaZ C-terminal domain-containing protein [Alicyclobacillaceae bacterium]|jgi:acyl dehydratase|uniref:MaoC family dehydratase n=1 Tax=Alicyclobacillus sp. SP_1 TaxID=2942475 RepID=UPI00215814AA|nr:MaoC/PaaZ C-terminal domain-containing protein [Alicyclobacillus sp. SP_1]MCY0887086.1 MaoC/PaaZ C-terminal domain-containing protein [Alicyclobacillaceae bacterium]MCY0894889.1 MaoC/PaaZ C-terminal domain-containing protein [Alicyclobacillaceae bacterium]